jgi:hypothetical protein
MMTRAMARSAARSRGERIAADEGGGGGGLTATDVPICDPSVTTGSRDLIHES